MKTISPISGLNKVRLCGTAFVWALTACGVCSAQVQAPTFQYRFGKELIPAATVDEPHAERFSSELAKTHLETGAALWSKQQKCVSCHTHGIYMLVRPALSRYWGKPDESTRDFVVTQAARLQASGDRTGSVPVQMAYVARGLAAWDAELRGRTSPETDAALRFAFEMQASDGSIRVKDRWPPLNSTTYFGTAMLAMAVADAPGWASGLVDDELLKKIERLNRFLRDTPPKNDHERLLLLWASTYLSDLLSSDRRQELIESIWRQQRDDGGWTIWTFATPETLGGGRKSESIRQQPDYITPSSDGFQTGLAIVVLRDAGVPADDPRITKAVTWLLSNQRQSGRWWTRSLNTESRFHFVSYSGTAYAALALAKCDALQQIAD